jgi:hypothetical protein
MPDPHEAIRQRAAEIRQEHEQARRLKAEKERKQAQAQRRCLDPPPDLQDRLQLAVDFMRWADKYGIPTVKFGRFDRGWEIASRSNYNPDSEAKFLPPPTRLSITTSGKIVGSIGAFSLQELQESIAQIVAKSGFPWWD